MSDSFRVGPLRQGVAAIRDIDAAGAAEKLKGKDGGVGVPRDSVTLSETAKALGAASSQASPERLSELKAQIDSGTFQVDRQRIARAIVADASSEHGKRGSGPPASLRAGVGGS